RAFFRAYPHGLVLTRKTGFSRPYGQNPYYGYDDASSPPLFAAAHRNDNRLAPKTRVVFIDRSHDSVVIPVPLLERRRRLRVTVDGHQLVVRWRPGVASALDATMIPRGRDVGSVSVTENGKPSLFDEPFWFAVAAFRPHIRIIR